MKHMRDSLVYKFGIAFLCFTIAAMLLVGGGVYAYQTTTLRRSGQESLHAVTRYLRDLMASDGEEFAVLQRYFLAHSDEMMVPYDFAGGYTEAYAAFYQAFVRAYPGKALGTDVAFDELSDELQNVYATAAFERWLTAFECAKREFDVEYVYYIVPGKESRHMVYVIDGVREERVVGDETFIELGIDAYEDPALYPEMWETWETGTEGHRVDVVDTSYGHTYACYEPLIVDGRTLGLVCAEVTVASVGRATFVSVFNQVAIMGIALLVCEGSLLGYINRRYLAKIKRLEASVCSYTQDKDVAVVRRIDADAVGSDEISSLCNEVAVMIVELERYMQRLLDTARELATTREEADLLGALARTDTLTGLPNKTAYDEAMELVGLDVLAGTARFAIVMIDLNYLKRTNDLYGHQAGDRALCKMADLIGEAFADVPAYRIGGDEFVVVVCGEACDGLDESVARLEAALSEASADERLDPCERISASVGVAVFDPAHDDGPAEVFKRADVAMYQRKRAMKAAREE